MSAQGTLSLHSTERKLGDSTSGKLADPWKKDLKAKFEGPWKCLSYHPKPFCELKGTFNQLFRISLLNMNIELKESSEKKIRTIEKKKFRGKRGRVRNGRKLQENYNYHITSRK